MKTETREQFIERCKASKSLEPQERETTIRFARDEDVFEIYTCEKTIVKSVLSNENAEIDWVQCENADGAFLQTTDPGEPDWRTFIVMGVQATMPIGCLSIKSKPRGNDYHSSIV